MDKYAKLRPPKETSITEICQCSKRSAIVLQSSLSYNPIACVDCNLVVNPDQLGFSNDLIEEIVAWRNFHYSFYNLWLDSEEFEIWAKDQLSRADSPVNVRGLATRANIGMYTECYYWWFVDNSSEGYQNIEKCPSCGSSLINKKNGFSFRTKFCEHCKIIIAEY